MDAKERVEGRDHIVLTINILWQVWKYRNGIQFNRDGRCPGETVNKAMLEWLEYMNVGSEEAFDRKAGEDKAIKGVRWSLPPKGYIIMNTDASLNTQK